MVALLRTAQMLNYNTMRSLINGGTFVQDNPSCNFTGFTVTTVAIFNECIQNNGACAGAENGST
jgi:hypothetical protein